LDLFTRVEKLSLIYFPQKESRVESCSSQYSKDDLEFSENEGSVMRQNGKNKFRISARVGITALFIGGGVFAVLFILIYSNRPPKKPVGPATAALTVIPSMSGTITPTAKDPIPSESPSETSTLEPGIFGIGAFAQVGGTEGEGLRLRQGPGLGYEIQFLGLDGELFQVGDGPVDADGYQWWFLIGSYDETRQGWAVVDYLSLLPSP